MPINAIIYARTSPDCPLSAEDQIKHLNAVAAEHGWTVTSTFSDRPMPVKKGRERRSGEDAMMGAIRRGEVQKVLLWSIDRVGRSLPDLIGFLDVCRSVDISVFLHEQMIDTETANGMSLFDLAAMMAFHLRQSRRDRILRGQAAARNASVRFGRPSLSVAKAEKARRLLGDGKGVRQVARMAGISAASVSRLKNASAQVSAGA